MKGVWGFPNNKMSSSGARQNRSFFRCVRTPDVLAILSNLISADTTRSRFCKSRSAYFRKFSAAILNKRQSDVRCKVKGFQNIFLTRLDISAFLVRWIVKSEDVGTKPIPDSLSEVRGFSKFPFRHYQVSNKKCPLYCERSVSISQTAHDPSARKSA